MISLGVDIGGTGVKCAAFSDDGRRLALRYEEYPLPPGQADRPPEVLAGSVFRVIRGCTDEISCPNEIAAVTLSSFGESFVAVDGEGRALDCIRMYFDRNESAEFDSLVESVGEENFMRICRIRPNPTYSLAKMLATRKTAPQPVEKYLFIASYVAFLLSGRAAVDLSLATRTLLYDVAAGDWSDELLSASGFAREQLPEVVPSGAALGTILPGMARQLNLPETALVVMGAQDQIVNALGAGVRETGDAVDTFGTCECITPLFDALPGHIRMQEFNFSGVPYLGTGKYATYAYNISAGSVVRWFRDEMACHMANEHESIYDALNRAAPGEPTDLIVLPFLQGMGGTPDVKADATGLIAGLTTATQLPDLYRALLEGVTFEMRYNQEKLRENGVTVRRLFAAGGGAQSDVWLSVKANILGCDILPVAEKETGALGSAILGLAAATGRGPLEIAPRFLHYRAAVRPDPERAKIYDRKYQLYKALRAFYKEI